MKEYASVLEAATPRPGVIGAERTIPGSFNDLVVSYYRSPKFRALRESTQTKNRYILERFRKEHGDKPIARLTRKNISDFHGEKWNTPEAANSLLKVLRVLLDYAVSIGMIPNNPAIGVEKYPANPDGIHAWSEDEAAQYIARHPLGTMAHLAMMLMVCTGQRKSDVMHMGWQHINRGKIAVRQQKTNTPLLIPIHFDLGNTLAALPRTNLTFLVTEQGKPFSSKESFGNWMRKRCDEAGLSQCSSHGLRKLAATRLANVGCSEREIMAITGHKSVSEVSRYTKERDQAALAETAMAKLTTAPRTKADEKLSRDTDPVLSRDSK
jgi:integrase